MTCRFKALQPSPHYARSSHFLLYFFNRKITGKAITGHMKCKFIQYFLQDFKQLLVKADKLIYLLVQVTVGFQL